jgi:thermitase
MTRILKSLGKNHRRVKSLLLAVFVLFIPYTATAAPVELILHGRTLTLRAEDASLYDILTAFAAYGVAVEAQPGIRTRFSGTLNSMSIHEALDEILQHHPHSTSWREFPYHGGFLHVLSAIQVYANTGGGGDPLRPIEPGPRRILTLPTGEAYLADEVLIGIRPGSDPDAFRRLLHSMGGQVISVNAAVGIYRIRLPQNTALPALLEGLARNGIVAIAEPNFVYPALPPFAAETRAVSAASAPPSIRPPAPGHPALAIIDSGLDPARIHADILRTGRDITGANNPYEDPVGHGTHMAWIAAGLTGTPGHGATGASVPLVPIRGLDPDGNTHTFGILEALSFAAESGARVVSMSWGAYTESAILEHGLRQAADQGLILLASAGNDGRNQLMFPAAYSSVIAVGAAAPNGTREAYSNYGSGLDLLAPGTAVLSGEEQESLLRGTSMATPWVGAALTAWLHQHPEATADEALNALRLVLQSTGNAENEEPGLFDEAARARFLGISATD